MSVTGYSDSDRVHRRSLHRRDDSGELDVFEAARYFSGYADIISCDYNPTNSSRKFALDRDITRLQSTGGDEHFRSSGRDRIGNHVLEPNKEKVGKHGHRHQPSSPGGRLASFLNSLFSQSAAKKKKKSTKSSLTTQSLKDREDYDANESGGWRRRRRSSISHFRSSSSVTKSTAITDSKSLYSSSSSGFRTPPPSKSYKDLRSLSEHKEMSLRPAALVQNDRHRGSSRGGFWNKYGGRGTGETETGGGREFRIRKFGYDDDDNDSDSSSDLFELQNYDLGYCSSGLPVYETTRLDSIKRGASISNVAA